ncbi:hypothetical protein Tco_0278341 [Tanacetum coccineum]
MIGDMDFIEKYMLETILHAQETQRLLNKRKLQMQKYKDTVVQAFDANLVVTESSGTVSGTQNVSSRISSGLSGNDTKADGADIRPTYDTDSLEQVDNDDYNVFAIEKEHREQPESVNDTYLVEQGDTNITPNSLDMSNNREEAD